MSRLELRLSDVKRMLGAYTFSPNHFKWGFVILLLKLEWLEVGESVQGGSFANWTSLKIGETSRWWLVSFSLPSFTSLWMFYGHFASISLPYPLLQDELSTLGAPEDAATLPCNP